MSESTLPPAPSGMAKALVMPNHRLAAVSDAFAELLGYTPQELCGRTLESITYYADADIDCDLARQVFAGELREYEVAKRYVHKNGRLIRAMLRTSAIRDAKGRIVYEIVKLVPIRKADGGPSADDRDDPSSDQIDRIKRAMLFSGAIA